MKTLLATLIISLLTSMASAATFEQLVVKAQESCPRLNCHNSPLRLKDAVNIQPELVDQLTEAAEGLAQVWGDTILEGDFYSFEPVKLDRVEIVVLKQKALGYRVTYSARAWFTGRCEIAAGNGDILQQLSNCVEGRIVESGFVSVDFSESFHDLKSLAKFSEL